MPQASSIFFNAFRPSDTGTGVALPAGGGVAIPGVGMVSPGVVTASLAEAA
jgi:hypothetical protein